MQIYFSKQNYLRIKLFVKLCSTILGNEGRFEGKVVIVTGASSGIGRAAAIEFAKEGAHVVITGQNSQRLDVSIFNLNLTPNFQTLI